jgi:hypothetical protein
MVVGKVVPQRAMVLVPPMDAERVMNDGVAAGAWSFMLDPGPDPLPHLCRAPVDLSGAGIALPHGMVRGVPGDPDAGALRDPLTSRSSLALGTTTVVIVLIGMLLPFSPVLIYVSITRRWDDHKPTLVS